MGQIKNWEVNTIDNSGSPISWENEISGNVIRVTGERGLWMVERTVTSPRNLREFKTKEQAKCFAISWMKRNPRG